MKSKFKWVLFAAAILVVAVAAYAFISLRPADRLHAKPRKEWKDNAIPIVERKASDSAWVTNQIAALKATITAGRNSERDWMGDELLLMENGEWIVYASHCHKADQRIHDIFIGRASDGKWYYSTFHFCIRMYTLTFYERPPSLDRFIRDYSLREFDGRSDECLKKTWPPTTRRKTSPTNDWRSL